MTQLGLNWDAPRRVARECSAQARASVDADTARGQILVALRMAKDGLTAVELEAVTGRKGSCVRPRLLELEKAGWVARTTRTRKADGARTPSQVWEAR